MITITVSRVVQCLTVVYAAGVSVADAFGAGNSILAPVTNSVWRIEQASPTVALLPGGSFANITALANDSNGNPPTLLSALPVGARGYPPVAVPPAAPLKYSTSLLTNKGRKFEAIAQAKAQVPKFGTLNTGIFPVRVGWWSAAGSTAAISVLNDDDIDETAQAKWNIVDPLEFVTVAGAEFDVTFEPFDSWDIEFADPSLGYSASVSLSGTASTSIPGIEHLFSWSISMATDSPGSVDVSFSSNAVLGFDDASIVNDIANRYSFDALMNSYEFNPLGFQLHTKVTVPSGITTVEFTTGNTVQIDAASVPEPCSLILWLMLGCLVTVGESRYSNVCSKRAIHKMSF